MAETKRSPLGFALVGSAFVQRFILAEILGPPKSLDGRRGARMPQQPVAKPED